MSLETLVFIPIAVAALIAAALFVARMARAWKSTDGERVRDEDRVRLALLDEKARLLLTLRDLEGEHAAGKLSDADFRALEARFQAEALQVMKRLQAHEESAR
ncbi:MAG: hypothetical protein IT385_18190 [Deltaproteobacteria bacterium]|nr:hypothetical protein [Deltaproteobacteria bacterium]